MTRGTLFGLGVGPGDPELITLKAHRLLTTVPVVAYPAPEHGDSLARSIVASFLSPEQTEIAIRMPLDLNRFPVEAVYDQAAIDIAEHLDAGRDVAAICEGDPFFYGSFMYLFQRLIDDFDVEVVPGVSSVMACAAEAGMPLGERTDVITILPASLSEIDLENKLRDTDTAVIMKVGRHLSKVRTIVERLGLIAEACYVERATLPEQRIIPLAEISDDAAPYFSMILVQSNGGRS